MTKLCLTDWSPCFEYVANPTTMALFPTSLLATMYVIRLHTFKDPISPHYKTTPPGKLIPKRTLLTFPPPPIFLPPPPPP